jgi:hypothetical protein
MRTRLMSRRCTSITASTTPSARCRTRRRRLGFDRADSVAIRSVPAHCRGVITKRCEVLQSVRNVLRPRCRMAQVPVEQASDPTLDPHHVPGPGSPWQITSLGSTGATAHVASGDGTQPTVASCTVHSIRGADRSPGSFAWCGQHAAPDSPSSSDTSSWSAVIASGTGTTLTPTARRCSSTAWTVDVHGCEGRCTRFPTITIERAATDPSDLPERCSGVRVSRG